MTVGVLVGEVVVVECIKRWVLMPDVAHYFREAGLSLSINLARPVSSDELRRTLSLPLQTNITGLLRGGRRRIRAFSTAYFRCHYDESEQTGETLDA